MRAELNIRELAYIASKSEFILCLEGFLNHLASCFQKKTFIVTSGFIPSSVISYKNTYLLNQKINHCATLVTY
jgi:ADP-heptose:LPS heptosyltransferase